MKRTLLTHLFFLFAIYLPANAKILSQKDQVQAQDKPIQTDQVNEWNKPAAPEEPRQINVETHTSLASMVGMKSSVYIGVAAGYANHQYNYAQNAEGDLLNINPSNDTATLSLFPGIQALFGDVMVGVEGLYIFDKSKSYNEFNSSGGVSQANTTFTSNHVWGCAFRAGFQVVQGFIPYISLGYRQQKIRLKAFITGSPAFPGVNQETNYQAFVPGLGVDYMVNNDISLRLQYDVAFYNRKTMTVNNADGAGNPDIESITPRVRTLSVGVAYHF